MNKSKLTPLKNKLWKLTSEYIRRRDADFEGMVLCCTCGIRKHWKELQAGHFIPQAQGNATRWDLTNIHPQCYRCNINLGGNGPEYYPYIEKRYGSGYADELRLKSKDIVKLTANDYICMIEEIKTKLAALNV